MKKNPIISVFKDMIYYGLETFGRYYSSYRAFVFDVKDPLNIQRVKLIIPEVGGPNPYEYWAFPKGVFSGPGYGTQMIPQPGDTVWVEFQRGHPDVPVYSLGHFGGQEIPTDDDDLLDPNCYWMITPQGHRLKINDTKNYISIQAKNGAKVVLNATGLISISNNNTNLKTVLKDMITTYMKTTTIEGEPLSVDSMNAALNNLQELSKLLS